MPASPTEQTPLAAMMSGRSEGALMNFQSVKTIFLTFLYITFSVGLINFNKWLMDDRFAYAVPLTLIQMAFSTCFSCTLIYLQPWLYPALTDPAQKIPIDTAFIWQAAVPIGAFFATSLVLTNLAYEHLGVAFLQMMKESNIVLVYLLSLLAAIEVFSWRHVQVILFAIFAASLTIKGELNFSLTGFLIQLTGGCCECARIVLQGIVLSGKKLDALSYVLIISPICFMLLFVFMCFLCLLPAGLAGPGLSIPPIATVWAWAPVLLCNCIVAFCLNVSIALLIKNTSPTSYIFVGILKDIIAILTSVVVLKEVVSSLQWVSFTMQIGTVIVWSLLKKFPEKFGNGILPGLQAVLIDDKTADAEVFELKCPRYMSSGGAEDALESKLGGGSSKV